MSANLQNLINQGSHSTKHSNHGSQMGNNQVSSSHARGGSGSDRHHASSKISSSRNGSKQKNNYSQGNFKSHQNDMSSTKNSGTVQSTKQSSDAALYSSNMQRMIELQA